MQEQQLQATGDEWLDERLAEIEEIADPSKKVEALVNLASQMLPSSSEVLAQALTAAKTIQNEYARAKVLAAIASQLPEPERHNLLEQALAAANTTQDEAFRAQALAAIAPQLPEPERHNLLEQALAAANTTQDEANTIQDELSLADALAAIASQLAKTELHLMERALTATNTIQNEYARAKVLAAIAPQLPQTEPHLMKQALTVANTIQDEAFRAKALAAIAPQLPEPERHNLLEQALAVANTIQNEFRGDALAAIAPQLPEPERHNLLEQALAAANTIQYEFDRADALAAIAPQLPEPERHNLLEQALAAANTIQDEANTVRDEYFRANALAAIALQLPKTEPHLMEQALTVANTIPDENYRAKVLAAIAPQLPKTEPHLMEQALTVANTIPDENYRANILTTIAPQLPQTERQNILLKKALTAANTIQDEFSRDDALAAIALQWPKTERHNTIEQALTVGNTIPDENYRTNVLTDIAPQLPKTECHYDLEKALAAANIIQNEDDRARVLEAIAPQLPEPEHHNVLEQALAAANTIQNESERAAVLATIAPLLPKIESHLVEQALMAANTIQNEALRAYVLTVITPLIRLSQLSIFLKAAFNSHNAAELLSSPATRFLEDFLRLYPSNKHSTALQIIQYIPEDADKTKFLSALAPYLSRFSAGLLPNALRTIQEHFTSDRYRTEALNNLIPYLPQDQLPEALQLINQSIKTPYYKSSALAELIPLLGSQHFNVVLDEINTLFYPQLKAKVLGVVATTLATDTLATVVDRVDTKVTPTLSDVNIALLDHVIDRPQLIARTFALAQTLKNFQGEDFSYERTLSSVVSQLAPVLQYLNESQQQEVQQSIQELKDPGYQAATLIALAPFYPDFVRACLSSFNRDDYRTLLQIKIQLALPDTLNAKSLESLLDEIKSEYRRAEALAEIASHPAGGGYQTDALQAIRELKNNAYLQTKYLQRLIPHLHYQQRLEAANVINDISDDYHRVSARVALARKFPESEFFIPARDGALALKSTVQQIEQLSTLAIDMPELLPRIIKIAESSEVTLPVEVGEDTDQETNNFKRKVERHQILTALAPHLPMRINREVKREWSLSRPVSDDLWSRALYLLARGYRDALRVGGLRNETAQDQDFLGLKDEINALSSLLLMRDLEPPMTVGILGGWGGGKSYIMHLMQEHMTSLRSRSVDLDEEAWHPDPNHEKLSPYVGHIYQIKFDAWTFAKSNLWASLMQTIFFELNRQISLEQQIAEALADVPDNATDADRDNARAQVLCQSGEYWSALYKASDEDRQWFLDHKLNPEQLKRLDDIRNQGHFADELWQQFGDTYRDESEKLAKLQKELAKKTQALVKRRENLTQSIEDELINQVLESPAVAPVAAILSSRISQKAFDDLTQTLRKCIVAEVSKNPDAQQAIATADLEQLKAIVQAVSIRVFNSRAGQLSFSSFWTWFKSNLRLLGLLTFFLLLAVLLPVAVNQLWGWLFPTFNSLVATVVAVLAPLAPAIAALQTMLRSAQKWFEETNLAVKEYETQLQFIPEHIQASKTQRIQSTIEQDPQVSALEADILRLKQQIAEQQERVPKNVYASLAEFVSGRLESDSYNKHLGMMHQVKDDLVDLSNRLLPPPSSSREFAAKLEQLKKIFPRGPARAVVYIDDLDRCPPRRVVQVLEAVQLLVKTPLFIAVLAIDERYITRALEQYYKGVLHRKGSPSGTDYLEKIIQLPYRVRPIMPGALETYLRAQVVIQDNASGGSKFSEFTRQEFDILKKCCGQTGLSPRTLKRLTNVYKLFKVVCRTRGTKTSLQVQQAILALLALSGRYPNLMRGIFDSMESCYEEERTREDIETLIQDADKQALAKSQRPLLHMDSPLRDAFKEYSLPECDQYLQREFAKLYHDAIETNILPPETFTLRDLTHEIFNLIRSFSFVGEIGEDPEDYRQSGLVNTDSSK
jgi:predicted KAP-like P-loop ATPase